MFHSDMARNTYSTYEAKARFSELLRKVREGETVTVTYHGEPVAQIRPIPKAEGIEARVDELRRTGQMTGAAERRGGLEPVARRPGALRRFLEDRNRF